MYHYDIGKSTLDIWAEEQDERQSVKQATQTKLAETAQLLRALITNKSSPITESSKGEYHE